jgi:hypothetical protein
MRTLCLVLGFILLTACAHGAQATKAIFYQPQSADRKVDEARWPALFERARAQGFDTLVVQWVEYGDAFADPAGRAWLSRRLHEAHAAGLKLVIGLGSDPAFFERQKLPTPELRPYLRQLAEHDQRLARAWTTKLGANLIAGWYLPLEIDDVRWRDADARALLVSHLREEVQALRRVAPRPVYVTSFFAGNMAPGRYADLIGALRTSGVHVWIQDGAGTGRLSRAERRLYLAPAERCKDPGADGIVYELFRQTAHDRVFAARPLGPAELKQVLAQRAPCGGDSVFFAMRYLPGMEVLLPRR